MQGTFTGATSSDSEGDSDHEMDSIASHDDQASI